MMKTFFTRGQFRPPGIVVAWVCVCVSIACPRDNSGPVQARITKLGPKMQNTFKVKFNLKVQIYPILSLSAP